jgi:hypothetical protein
MLVSAINLASPRTLPDSFFGHFLDVTSVRSTFDKTNSALPSALLA